MKFSRLNDLLAPRQPHVTRARTDRAQPQPHQGDGGGRLAHRYLALRALRQLARGHYLVVAGQTSLGVRLEGIADAIHLAEDFIAMRLVEEIRAERGVQWYAISAFGRDTLRRGEAWWATLGYRERLQVRFGG